MSDSEESEEDADTGAYVLNRFATAVPVPEAADVNQAAGSRVGLGATLKGPSSLRGFRGAADGNCGRMRGFSGGRARRASSVGDHDPQGSTSHRKARGKESAAASDLPAASEFPAAARISSSSVLHAELFRRIRERRLRVMSMSVTGQPVVRVATDYSLADGGGGVFLNLEGQHYLLVTDAELPQLLAMDISFDAAALGNVADDYQLTDSVETEVRRYKEQLRRAGDSAASRQQPQAFAPRPLVPAELHDRMKRPLPDGLVQRQEVPSFMLMQNDPVRLDVAAACGVGMEEVLARQMPVAAGLSEDVGPVTLEVLRAERQALNPVHHRLDTLPPVDESGNRLPTRTYKKLPNYRAAYRRGRRCFGVDPFDLAGFEEKFGVTVPDDTPLQLQLRLYESEQIISRQVPVVFKWAIPRRTFDELMQPRQSKAKWKVHKTADGRAKKNESGSYRAPSTAPGVLKDVFSLFNCTCQLAMCETMAFSLLKTDVPLPVDVEQAWAYARGQCCDESCRLNYYFIVPIDMSLKRRRKEDVVLWIVMQSNRYLPTHDATNLSQDHSRSVPRGIHWLPSADDSQALEELASAAESAGYTAYADCMRRSQLGDYSNGGNDEASGRADGPSRRPFQLRRRHPMSAIARRRIGEALDNGRAPQQIANELASELPTQRHLLQSYGTTPSVEAIRQFSRRRRRGRGSLPLPQLVAELQACFAEKTSHYALPGYVREVTESADGIFVQCQEEFNWLQTACASGRCVIVADSTGGVVNDFGPKAPTHVTAFIAVVEDGYGKAVHSSVVGQWMTTNKDYASVERGFLLLVDILGRLAADLPRPIAFISDCEWALRKSALRAFNNMSATEYAAFTSRILLGEARVDEILDCTYLRVCDSHFLQLIKRTLTRNCPDDTMNGSSGNAREKRRLLLLVVQYLVECTSEPAFAEMLQNVYVVLTAPTLLPTVVTATAAVHDALTIYDVPRRVGPGGAVASGGVSTRQDLWPPLSLAEEEDELDAEIGGVAANVTSIKDNNVYWMRLRGRITDYRSGLLAEDAHDARVGVESENPLHMPWAIDLLWANWLPYLQWWSSIMFNPARYGSDLCEIEVSALDMAVPSRFATTSAVVESFFALLKRWWLQAAGSKGRKMSLDDVLICLYPEVRRLAKTTLLAYKAGLANVTSSKKKAKHVQPVPRYGSVRKPRPSTSRPTSPREPPGSRRTSPANLSPRARPSSSSRPSVNASPRAPPAKERTRTPTPSVRPSPIGSRRPSANESPPEPPGSPTTGTPTGQARAQPASPLTSTPHPAPSRPTPCAEQLGASSSCGSPRVRSSTSTASGKRARLELSRSGSASPQTNGLNSTAHSPHVARPTLPASRARLPSTSSVAERSPSQSVAAERPTAPVVPAPPSETVSAPAVTAATPSAGAAAAADATAAPSEAASAAGDVATAPSGSGAAAASSTAAMSERVSAAATTADFASENSTAATVTAAAVSTSAACAPCAESASLPSDNEPTAPPTRPLPFSQAKTQLTSERRTQTVSATRTQPALKRRVPKRVSTEVPIEVSPPLPTVPGPKRRRWQGRFASVTTATTVTNETPVAVTVTEVHVDEPSIAEAELPDEADDQDRVHPRVDEGPGLWRDKPQEEPGNLRDSSLYKWKRPTDAPRMVTRLAAKVYGAVLAGSSSTSTVESSVPSTIVPPAMRGRGASRGRGRGRGAARTCSPPRQQGGVGGRRRATSVSTRGTRKTDRTRCSTAPTTRATSQAATAADSTAADSTAGARSATKHGRSFGSGRAAAPVQVGVDKATSRLSPVREAPEEVSTDVSDTGGRGRAHQSAPQPPPTEPPPTQPPPTQPPPTQPPPSSGSEEETVVEDEGGGEGALDADEWPLVSSSSVTQLSSVVRHQYAAYVEYCVRGANCAFAGQRWPTEQPLPQPDGEVSDGSGPWLVGATAALEARRNPVTVDPTTGVLVEPAGGLTLTQAERDEVLTLGSCLSEKAVNLFQSRLKEHFPHFRGCQVVSLASQGWNTATLAECDPGRQLLQVLHLGGSAAGHYYLLASNPKGTDDADYVIYDSMPNKTCIPSTQMLDGVCAAARIQGASRAIKLRVAKVTQQEPGSNTCGLMCCAYMWCVAVGSDPNCEQITPDQSLLRRLFLDSLEKRDLSLLAGVVEGFDAVDKPRSQSAGFYRLFPSADAYDEADAAGLTEVSGIRRFVVRVGCVDHCRRPSVVDEMSNRNAVCFVCNNFYHKECLIGVPKQCFEPPKFLANKAIASPTALFCCPSCIGAGRHLDAGGEVHTRPAMVQCPFVTGGAAATTKYARFVAASLRRQSASSPNAVSPAAVADDRWLELLCSSDAVGDDVIEAAVAATTIDDTEQLLLPHCRDGHCLLMRVLPKAATIEFYGPGLSELALETQCAISSSLTRKLLVQSGLARGELWRIVKFDLSIFGDATQSAVYCCLILKCMGHGVPPYFLGGGTQTEAYWFASIANDFDFEQVLPACTAQKAIVFSL